MSENVHEYIKRGAYIPFTREMLLDAGMVEPTPEERAAMERAEAEARQRAAVRAEKLAEARRQFAALDDPLTRVVLDLHAEDEHGDCEGCDFGGYEGERPGWPCRTVEAVAAHYGIDLGLQP